ncbi:hypothetical protein E0198_001533 [Clavispora lusitaniae]|nr:hypothetical protein E0198_001533 [Clavispora lusitaniae]
MNNGDSRVWPYKERLGLTRELNEILGEDEEDSEEEESKPKSGFLSKVTSYFGSTAPIDEVSKKFNDQLISKNIAPPTAKAITEKIKTRLTKRSP